MTTKAELQKLIDELKAKFHELEEFLGLTSKDEPASTGRWKPGICEKYWVVSGSTGVFRFIGKIPAQTITCLHSPASTAPKKKHKPHSTSKWLPCAFLIESRN